MSANKKFETYIRDYFTLMLYAAREDFLRLNGAEDTYTSAAGYQTYANLSLKDKSPGKNAIYRLDTGMQQNIRHMLFAAINELQSVTIGQSTTTEDLATDDEQSMLAFMMRESAHGMPIGNTLRDCPDKKGNLRALVVERLKLTDEVTLARVVTSLQMFLKRYAARIVASLFYNERVLNSKFWLGMLAMLGMNADLIDEIAGDMREEPVRKAPARKKKAGETLVPAGKEAAEVTTQEPIDAGSMLSSLTALEISSEAQTTTEVTGI